MISPAKPVSKKGKAKAEPEAQSIENPFERNSDGAFVDIGGKRRLTINEFKGNLYVGLRGESLIARHLQVSAHTVETPFRRTLPDLQSTTKTRRQASCCPERKGYRSTSRRYVSSSYRATSPSEWPYLPTLSVRESAGPLCERSREFRKPDWVPPEMARD